MNNAQNKREIIDFPPNIPITVALKYPTAKLVQTQHGDRAMFSLADNRVMFLDLDVAAQIEATGVSVQQPFTITRQQNGNKEKSTWHVARLLTAGRQPDGTFVVPKGPQAQPVPKPVVRATSSSLVDEANALVDAYAQILDRALKMHQGRVKPDEVRALTVTAYIQRSRLSSVA